ncbi:MAG: hydroxyacid dehydrogenase, partial [Limnohabitans sp.]|nr:hydroxyacid dehydrogenase [Limnohabitans sp.]
SAFAEKIGASKDFDLQTFDINHESQAWAALETAHIYQITSARDELPPILHANSKLLARCPNLFCISTGGAGFDTVEVEACNQAGVLVLNQSGSNAQSVAEAVIGLMIDLTHRLTVCDRRMRLDRNFVREDFMGQEITCETVGIVGLGNVGRRVARLASAFDMKILAYDPLLSSNEIIQRGAEPVTLDVLLNRSDIVTVHCPRDATTIGLFDASAFAAMKQGAFFINTARGGIHNQSDLLSALESGQVAGAGLDVWDIEPPPINDPLLHHPNVIGTYHCAGVTKQSRRRMAEWAADQLISMAIHGNKPLRIINPQVWPLVQEKLATARST